MPTLNWIGKEAVSKHHKQVPFRLLEPVGELACGEVDSGNLTGRAHENYQIKSKQYQRLLLGPAEVWHATAMLAY